MGKIKLRYSVLAALAAAMLCSGAAADPYVIDPQRASGAPPADLIDRSAGGTAAQGLVEVASNRSFEINGGVGSADLEAWTVINIEGDDGGKRAAKGQVQGTIGWQAQSGTSSPLASFEVNPPTDGQFAAMTDQDGPSAHILYQDVVIPDGGATIAFDLFLSNQASDFFVPDPATLDPDVPEENQQFRADLIDPAADVLDVGAGVVQNLYQTLPGDDLVSGYTRIINVVPGNGVQRTLRLRFAVANNEFFFNVGVDNVSVLANARTIPVNQHGWLIGLGLLLGAVGLIAARRPIV